MELQKALLDFIHRELLDHDDEKVTLEEDLLNSGLIDSLGIVRVIAFIEEHEQIKVPPQDMVIENFISVEAIVSYAKKKKVS